MSVANFLIHFAIALPAVMGTWWTKIVFEQRKNKQIYKSKKIIKNDLTNSDLWDCSSSMTCFLLCAKKPIITMLTYPWNVQFYIVTTWETPGNHWC